MLLSFRRTHPRAYWVLTVVLLLVLLAYAYAGLFGPGGNSLENEEFLVSPGETIDDVSRALASRGLIGNTFGFGIAYVRMSGTLEMHPGGYELAPGMDAWTVAQILSAPPRLAWIRIPDGYRKEQIAELLTRSLGWTEEEKHEWLTVDTASPIEGEYYPDIYLIPSDQTPAEVANRLRERFTHETEALAAEASAEQVDWVKVLTIASLIEREADGPHDMGLISGIIWNRLNIDMPLGIDATLQYIRGAPGSWWPTPTSEDKYLTSPYNTYFKPGLPPAPIANPSVEAIVAALEPEKTDCLYYLHDYDGNIHCAKTYAAHVANVKRYLR